MVNYELEQDWSVIRVLRLDQEAKKWKLEFKLRVGNYEQELSTGNQGSTFKHRPHYL